MGTYTYFAYDLRGNYPVAELPLSQVTYGWDLGGDDKLTATIDVGQLDARIDLSSVLPARTQVIVDLDGRLMWGGILWNWDPTPTGIVIPDGLCAGYMSYFGRRTIRQTLTFAQVDQLQIAESIVQAMQAPAGGSIGVEILGLRSGVLRDRTYPGTEEKPAREALLELAGVDNGFDVVIGCEYGGDGLPRKTLQLGYPHLGRPVAESSLSFEYPGNIESYTWEGTAELATHVSALGTGQGELVLRALATNQALTDAGWPILDTSVSYVDVSLQGTLDAHARAEADARAGIVVNPVLTVGPVDPQLGSYSVGDWARVRIEDDVFGGGPLPAVDIEARITNIRVTVPDDTDDEVVELTFAGVVIRP